MSNGPYVSDRVAKCWPEVPITLDVIFAEVKFLAVRVDQLKHTALVALLWKAIGVECFPFTRFLTRLYCDVMVVGSHRPKTQCTKTHFGGNRVNQDLRFVVTTHVVIVLTAWVLGARQSSPTIRRATCAMAMLTSFVMD